MQTFDSVWSDILKEADTNNDGEIDFNEFENAMKSVLQARATFVKKKNVKKW